MKILLSILTISLVIFSCTKEDNFQNTRGLKLLSITYKDGEQVGNNWSELYSYNNSGILYAIEDTRGIGINYKLTYTNNNQLQEYTAYINETNELVSKDSIVYHQNGSIKAIFSFSKNLDDILTTSHINEFEYNNQGRVSQKKTFFALTDNYFSTEKYYWNAANINKVEIYDQKDKLLYEYSLTYDTNNNYKKNIAIYLNDPINWSENNVTKTSFTDYSGLLDLSCYTCITKYNYNLDKYPVSVKYDWGRQLTITYE